MPDEYFPCCLLTCSPHQLLIAVHGLRTFQNTWPSYNKPAHAPAVALRTLAVDPALDKERPRRTV